MHEDDYKRREIQLAMHEEMQLTSDRIQVFTGNKVVTLVAYNHKKATFCGIPLLSVFRLWKN